MIKFIRFRKLKNPKNKNKNTNKYEITLIKGGKKITRKFGKKIKNLKITGIKDPTNIKILTKFILANKPTLSAGLADYKRRLKIYNKTGRFPINIKKSKIKKSKYGMIRRFREKIYNLGDRIGSKKLKDIGLDPDDRLFEEKMAREFPDMSPKSIQKYNGIYSLRKNVKKLGESANKVRQNAARRIQRAWNSIPKRYEIVNNPEGIEMSNLFGVGPPKNVVNKKLYLSIKNKIKKSIRGRRWGAYDSGRLVRMYKNSGGKYSGKKGKTDLGRWYSEKWIDACSWPKRKPCGRKTKSSIAYCRPSKRIDFKTPKLIQSLSMSQIKSRCSRKKKNPKKRISF